MLKSLSRAQIHDAGAKGPPRRKRINPDGVVVWEKLPPMPYRTYVDASGSIINVPLTNSAALRNTNQAYAYRIQEMHKRAGSIPYEDCPARTLVGLPEKMRGRAPCDEREYGNGKCCRCVQEIIDARRAAHVRRELESQERHKSMEQRRMEMAEAREERVAAAEARALADDGAES